MGQDSLAALFRRRAMLQQQEQAANPDMQGGMAPGPSMPQGMPPMAAQAGPIPPGAIQNPLMSQAQFGNSQGTPRMTPQQSMQLQMLLKQRGMAQ